MMFKKYYDFGLIEKYNNTISNKKILSPKDIDYDFLAYMQHSVAYSPFIDITSKPEVGLVFALGNNAVFNVYNKKPAAFFEIIKKNIEGKENSENFWDEKFKVYILKGKITPNKKVNVETYDNKQETLDFTTIPNIINYLTPDYIIIDQVKNDRMRYQQGKFILFYNYLLVNNNVIYTLNKNFITFKYKVTVSSKKGIKEYLDENYSQYNMDYLMNPYDYFRK